MVETREQAQDEDDFVLGPVSMQGLVVEELPPQPVATFEQN